MSCDVDCFCCCNWDCPCAPDDTEDPECTDACGCDCARHTRVAEGGQEVAPPR